MGFENVMTLNIRLWSLDLFRFLSSSDMLWSFPLRWFMFFLICADFLQFWIGNETPTANDLCFRDQWGFGSMWSMSPSLSRKTASGQPLQAPLFHVPLKYKMGTIMRPDICKIPPAPGALHCWVSNLSHAPATESPVAGFWKKGGNGETMDFRYPIIGLLFFRAKRVPLKNFWDAKKKEIGSIKDPVLTMLAVTAARRYPTVIISSYPLQTLMVLDVLVCNCRTS